MDSSLCFETVFISTADNDFYFSTNSTPHESLKSPYLKFENTDCNAPDVVDQMCELFQQHFTQQL